MCAKHGNEFIDWKCMRCCSLAVFFCCRGKKTFCNPCHNDAMANVSNITTQCRGGKDCPLGIPEHPVASTDDASSCFAMGCSLCRSEKLALISDNEKASIGVNNEVRFGMKKLYDYVVGHDLDREMEIERGIQIELINQIEEENNQIREE